MKKTVIIILSCIILLIMIACILYFNRNREVYEPTNSDNYTIYDTYSQDEVAGIGENTVIQGIVELINKGYMYMFNGQHFGEFGFEMQEYTRANIYDKKQKCIDYFTLEQYDTSYIQEGDVLICTGIMGYNNFDTKDNAIIVLKSNDYDKIKKEVLNNERKSTIKVGAFFESSEEIYLKYNTEDNSYLGNTYNLSFVLKINFTNDIEIIGYLEKGKNVKAKYKDLNVAFDKLELKSIEVIEN